MPNWVTNTLVINKKDTNLVLNAESNVDFEILKPMPESLSVSTGSLDDRDIYYYLSDKCNIAHNAVNKMPEADLIKKDSFFLTPDQVLAQALQAAMKLIEEAESPTDEKLIDAYNHGKALVENYRKYNAKSWYDWSIDNWGCKWNASDTSVDEKNNDLVIITFMTPWSSPDGWIKALAAKGVHFKLFWIEEDSSVGAIINNAEHSLYEINDTYGSIYTDYPDDDDEDNDTDEEDPDVLIMIDGDYDNLTEQFCEKYALDLDKID